MNILILIKQYAYPEIEKKNEMKYKYEYYNLGKY